MTAAEMAATDGRSVELGAPIAHLMESAGAAVASFAQRLYPDAGVAQSSESIAQSKNRTGPIVVLAGRGNNGGDGMVAARHLCQAGRSVRLVLLGRADQLKDHLAVVWDQAQHEGAEIVEVADAEGLCAALREASLVVDAVVGTGVQPPLRGLAAVARDQLAHSTVPVLAVDLPSGWDADSPEETVEGAFRADAVVTFVAPKWAHLLGQLTSGSMGPVVLADIGTPAAALPPPAAADLYWAGAAKAVAEPPRNPKANKGMYGHVLVIGGALGKAGAPSMASLAALCAGAGLVTAAVPREILPTVAAVAAELMLTPLEQGSGFRAQSPEDGLSLEQLTEVPLRHLLGCATVVAMGPGLGQAGSTPEWVHEFVKAVTLPMVLDADALNAFAGKSYLLQEAVHMAAQLGQPRTLVLTPHPGEMARLTGLTVEQVQADRLNLARGFATKHGVTLVLKGRRTLIAHPDGRIGVNTTGNPAMAKGGSGDILTGIVGAMLAQYANARYGQLTPACVAEAVEAAVFLHGLAGDFAALDQDEHTVLATQTVAHLSAAFRARVTDAHGLTWLCGTARQQQLPAGSTTHSFSQEAQRG